MPVPSSLMNQIERAIVAALASPGTPAVDVDRNGVFEYTPEVMPAYNVVLLEYDPGFKSRSSDHESLRSTATWGVVCYAQAKGGITASDAVDPLLVWAHQQLADSDFGGLAVGTVLESVKVNWDQKEGNSAIEVLLTLQVEFDIARKDPSQNFNN